MCGQYDRCGNLCTIVFEVNKAFIVNRSPLKILNDSILCTGFNLAGAIESSKILLNQEQICPIVINPREEIIVFPTRSPNHIDNIWFNPHHIKRTTSYNRRTLIWFSDGTTFIFPSRLSDFNNKLKIADQLEEMTMHSPNMAFVMILDPKNRKKKKRTKKKDS